MGCASIHLRNNRANDYPLIHPSTSNKGWHSQWFYIKDDLSATLPKYSGRLIDEAPEPWQGGCLTPAKKHLTDLLAAIHSLKVRGVKGSGIIGCYHVRRVAR